MLNHSSATPHTIKSTKNLNVNGTNKKTISRSTKKRTLSPNGTSKRIVSDALKRRAQAVIKDSSIDAQVRAIIRYGLEINDPWLADLVRRVEAGEPIIETIVLLKRPKLTSRIQTGKRSKR